MCHIARLKARSRSADASGDPVKLSSRPIFNGVVVRCSFEVPSHPEAMTSRPVTATSKTTQNLIDSLLTWRFRLAVGDMNSVFSRGEPTSLDPTA